MKRFATAAVAAATALSLAAAPAQAAPRVRPLTLRRLKPQS